jgi:Rod binding domain-containing protein
MRGDLMQSFSSALASSGPAQKFAALGETRMAAKIKKAAQDFEAVLLQTLLEPLEKSFSTLPGKDDPSGADNYHYLGTQALASALSRSGGVGLAAMMVRNLLKSGKLQAKEPTPVADERR